MATETLPLCPFCGGNPLLRSWVEPGRDMGPFYSEGNAYANIECVKCMAKTRTCAVSYNEYSTNKERELVEKQATTLWCARIESSVDYNKNAMEKNCQVILKEGSNQDEK